MVVAGRIERKCATKSKNPSQRIHLALGQGGLLTPRDDDADRRVRSADDAERREVARVHVLRHREQDPARIW